MWHGKAKGKRWGFAGIGLFVLSGIWDLLEPIERLNLIREMVENRGMILRDTVEVLTDRWTPFVAAVVCIGVFVFLNVRPMSESGAASVPPSPQPPEGQARRSPIDDKTQVISNLANFRSEAERLAAEFKRLQTSGQHLEFFTLRNHTYQYILQNVSQDQAEYFLSKVNLKMGTSMGNFGEQQSMIDDLMVFSERLTRIIRDLRS